jgi:KipI family sensor histidine kinase inhibitor
MIAACEALADDAWLLRTGDACPPIDAQANARAHRIATRIRALSPPWLRDLVPAYAAVAVFFDPDAVAAEAVRDWLLAQCAVDAPDHRSDATRIVEIPVRYGDDCGADLDTAAAELGIAREALIARHCAPLYTVAMLGFAPGFPYLLGLDPDLALPRLATPRTRVPAGSVGIGGAQTGIYPCESPGGWRLIGRTPLRLFDAQRTTPSLLAPGDRVRFVAIDDARFAMLAAQAEAA